MLQTELLRRWLADAYGAEISLVDVMERQLADLSGQHEMDAKFFEYLDTLQRHANMLQDCIADLAVCRRERVFSEESALGGRFEVKIRATDAILPSHSTINEVGKLLSDRLLEGETNALNKGGLPTFINTTPRQRREDIYWSGL